MPRLLTERGVVEARQMYLGGNVSISDVANEYGLTKAGMQFVLDCTNWRELLAPDEENNLRRVRQSRQPQLKPRRRDYNGR
jgi:hypothetical protein